MLSKLYNLVRKPLRKFHNEEDAPTMTEYGLMLAAIAVVALVGAQLIGTNLLAVFNQIAGNITN